MKFLRRIQPVKERVSSICKIFGIAFKNITNQHVDPVRSQDISFL